MRSLAFYLHVGNIYETASFSLRVYASARETCLTLPFVIEVPVPSQNNERSCICIDVASFYDVSIVAWNCSDSVAFPLFHLIITFMFNTSLFEIWLTRTWTTYIPWVTEQFYCIVTTIMRRFDYMYIIH